MYGFNFREIPYDNTILLHIDAGEATHLVAQKILTGKPVVFDNAYSSVPEDYDWNGNSKKYKKEKQYGRKNYDSWRD